ncbi:hypothetical protein C0995_010365 [Termitomyces sp. Mi166|nr:hypothetical protein C0995_010365 [Termitomyces sp. Mi166\
MLDICAVAHWYHESIGVSHHNGVLWSVQSVNKVAYTPASRQIQARLAKAKELLESQQKQLTEIKEGIKIERSARIESELRSNALARLADLRKQVVILEKELGAYGDCDPVKIEEKKRAVFLAKEAALRWTDNYGTLLSHFVRQNNVDPAEIRRFLEIDEDYEDIS